MRDTIDFKSHVPKAHRASLEALVFFNSCQDRYAACIAEAVERFGSPEIVADGDRLRVRVAELDDVQSLFAIESATGRPVGLALYTRPDLEHISVVHLGISAEYASGGPRAAEQLLLRLLREVRRSTRRMKGVRRLELFYIKERTTTQRWREAKALA
jgi:hypothetical protein